MIERAPFRLLLGTTNPGLTSVYTIGDGYWGPPGVQFVVTSILYGWAPATPDSGSLALNGSVIVAFGDLLTLVAINGPPMPVDLPLIYDDQLIVTAGTSTPLSIALGGYIWRWGTHSAGSAGGDE